MTLGEMIRRLREEAGLSQQELAERLFVSRQTVSRWESGSRTPDIMTAKKIAALLGATLDELVPDGEGEEMPKAESRVPPEKRMQCGMFLGILSVWAAVWAMAANGTFLAVLSLVFLAAALVLFVFGYFPE